MSFDISYPDETPAPPTLTLLVNPSTFSIQFTKKVTPSFTRLGYVVEHWGEELDVISVEGRIGAYYVFPEAGLHVSRVHRKRAPSFRNLYSTICYENFNEHKIHADVIEALLHHQEANKVKKAYNRAKYLEPKKELIQWYADFLDKNYRK